MAGGVQETTAQLRELVEPAVTAAGFDLEDLAVSRAGSRSVVRIAVDRDGGVDLDAVATATRAISEVLDAHEDVIAGTYALEVTSPGVDRPLTAPRHWRRNVGRLVEVTRVEGAPVTGRLTAATADGATLLVGQASVEVAFPDVRRAVVQVEFSRPVGVAVVGLGDAEHADDIEDADDVEDADDEYDEELDDDADLPAEPDENDETGQEAQP